MRSSGIARPALEAGKRRTPQPLRLRSGQASTRERVELACAFCRGTGRDPFGLLSSLSKCQVCGGAGVRRLRQPAAPCAYCGKTGIHSFSRLTCTTCGGGSVEIPDGAVTCPGCEGTGREADYEYPDSVLSCRCCGVKGVVAPH